MRQTQAVILDLDGLMIDSEPLHQRAFEKVLARHGITYKFSVEEFANNFVGFPARENAKWLVEHFDLEDSPEDIVREREAIDELLFEDPSYLIPMPGVFEVLDALGERGVPLGIASASPRGQLEMILRGMGIAGRFRAIVAGTDVPHAKPAPDVYLRVMEELRMAPARCVVVEDSVAGITAAKAAGLYAIAVPNRYTTHQDLSRADAQVENLGEVVVYIR